MAKKERSTLKSFFKTGNVPSQAHYEHLIDSNLNLSATEQQTISSDLVINGAVDINNTLEVFSIDTGLGAFEVGQNTRTSDNVTFSSIFASGSNGHITASGNISASGKLRGNELFINDLSLARNTIGTTFLGNQNQSTTINGTSISLGSITNSIPVTVHNSITASGNISSSATLIANEANIIGNITASGAISASGNLLGNNLDLSGKITTTEITSSGDIRIGFNQNILGRQNSVTGTTVSLIRNVGVTLTQFGSFDANLVTLAGDVLLIDSEEGNIQFAKNSTQKLKFTLNDSDVRIESDHPIEIQSADDITLDAGGNNIYLRDGSSNPTIEFNTNTGLISGSSLKIDGSQVDFTGLPTSDPSSAGRLFTQTATQLGGSGTTKVICVSAG